MEKLTENLQPLATQLALQSDMKFRHGAVLFYPLRGEDSPHIVGVGINKAKKHSLLQEYDYPEWSGIHAEMAALIGAPAGDIVGSEMLVVRLTAAGIPTLSRPCENCIELLKSYGIVRVYYTNGFGELIKEEL